VPYDPNERERELLRRERELLQRERDLLERERGRGDRPRSSDPERDSIVKWALGPLACSNAVILVVILFVFIFGMVIWVVKEDGLDMLILVIAVAAVLVYLEQKGWI